MKQRPGVLKRQREVSRLAKQQEKREKKAQRKIDKENGVEVPDEEFENDDDDNEEEEKEVSEG